MTITFDPKTGIETTTGRDLFATRIYQEAWAGLAERLRKERAESMLKPFEGEGDLAARLSEARKALADIPEPSPEDVDPEWDAIILNDLKEMGITWNKNGDPLCHGSTMRAHPEPTPWIACRICSAKYSTRTLVHYGAKELKKKDGG